MTLHAWIATSTFFLTAFLFVGAIGELSAI